MAEDEDLINLRGWVSRHALEGDCAVLAEALQYVLDLEPIEDINDDYREGFRDGVLAARDVIEAVILP